VAELMTWEKMTEKVEIGYQETITRFQNTNGKKRQSLKKE
jgi:hypothetical protein